MSKLYVVGIGPGDLNNMTYEAREAIESADTVVGYTDLPGPYRTAPGRQRGRLLRHDEGGRALSRGAAASPLKGEPSPWSPAVTPASTAWPDWCWNSSPPEDIEVVIVPGVSAVQAAAAVLGAPLMHDFAVISLSDLLTPWEMIEKRLEAAAAPISSSPSTIPAARGGHARSSGHGRSSSPPVRPKPRSASSATPAARRGKDPFHPGRDAC